LLASEAFAYARPRELLLYLLMYPEGRTREQIGLVFWPDASAAQVKNNFHVTLHLVRKALGRADWVVFQKERYRINPDFRVELDAAEFEIGVTRALRDLGARGLVERLRDHLRLYRDPFLDDAGAGDWHLEHRDHLHRIYVDGALALGRVLARQGRDADAAAAFRDLLKREPLHEEGTRQLMSCLSRLGERVEAMRVYERLTALLRAELDAEPEAATAALYARIRKG
jgi:DNA-binding SARP family transcriptional activator